MDINTKYRVIFYVDSDIELENLIYGRVEPKHFNHQVLSNKMKMLNQH